LALVRFLKKGAILNLDVSSGVEQKFGPVMFTFSLADGYRLDPSTTPPPNRVGLDGSLYGWYLNPEPLPNRQGYRVVPTVRIVYESELWSQTRDYVLFVLAAVFGFSIQLGVDAVRNAARQQGPHSA
jgi:hypothetical protein